MALRLRIVGEQSAGLGDASTRVFGVHGGTIGRGRDNDWILPDPERYLSGSHVRVDFRAGAYVAVDLSSNGTYVNDASEPLGKFHEYTLQDGDFLRIGTYELRVSIDATNDFPPDASGVIAYDGGPPSAAVRTTTANDLGADLDLSELLETASPDQGPLLAPTRSVYDQALLAEPAPAAAPTAADAGTPWHMMTRPVRIGTGDGLDRPAAVAREPAADGDVEAGLAAFCRGAGLDPQSLPAHSRAAAMQLAGQLLREAILGMMELAQHRAELRGRLGVADAPEAEGPALNLERGSVQDILVRMLSRVATRAGSVDAMRERFRDLKAQNGATLSAMQAALTEVLTRLSPRELEERFERSASRGVFNAPPSRAKYWDMYAELYATLAQRPPDGFPHLFAEAFARDFAARMNELAPRRRAAFGGDA